MTVFANVGTHQEHQPSPIVEIGWQEAEVRFCRRLDRRMRYAVDDDELLVLTRWVSCCSGCSEVGDYECSPAAGCGCQECGYTGRRRSALWQSERIISAMRRFQRRQALKRCDGNRK